MPRKKHKTHIPRWQVSLNKRRAHVYDKSEEIVDRLDAMHVTRHDMLPDTTRKGKTKLGRVGERYKIYGQDLYGNHEVRKHGNKWVHVHNGQEMGEIEIEKPIRDALVHLSGDSAFDLSDRDRAEETEQYDTTYIYPDGRTRIIPTIKLTLQTGTHDAHTTQQDKQGNYVQTKPRKPVEDVVFGDTPTKPMARRLITIAQVRRLAPEIQDKLDANPLPQNEDEK